MTNTLIDLLHIILNLLGESSALSGQLTRHKDARDNNMSLYLVHCYVLYVEFGPCFIFSLVQHSVNNLYMLLCEVILTPQFPQSL